MSQTQRERPFEITAEEMLSLATELAGQISGNDAYSDAISAIVGEYLQRGNVDRAAELADTIEDPFSRDRLLVRIAERCAELDDDDYALQLADAIVEESLRQQALTLIGTQKVVKGQIKKAEAVAAELIHPDPILVAIAVSNFTDAAELAFTVAQLEDATTAAYGLIEAAEAKVDAENTDQAVDFLTCAAELCNRIEHPEEKARTLIDLGNCFAAASRRDLAISTLEAGRQAASAIDSIRRDGLLAAVAAGFLRAGSEELAERTLDLISDKTQLAAALKSMADEYARLGRVTDALEALNEADAILRGERESERRDSRASFSVRGAVAIAFAALNKAEIAIEIGESLPDDDIAANTLAGIAAELGKIGDQQAAWQAVMAIKDDAKRLFALITIFDQLEKAFPEIAKEFLEKAGQLADAPERFTVRLTANLEIADRYLAIGEVSAAANKCRETLQIFSNVRDVSIQAATLARFARLAAKGSFLPSEEASRLLSELRMQTLRSN